LTWVCDSQILAKRLLERHSDLSPGAAERGGSSVPPVPLPPRVGEASALL
jgi:hypothetical protein